MWCLFFCRFGCLCFFFSSFRMLLFSIGKSNILSFRIFKRYEFVFFSEYNHPPARREGGRVFPSSVFRIPHHFRCVGRPEPMAPRARCGGTTLVPDIHFFLCSPSTQAIGHAGPRDLSVRPPNPRGVKWLQQKLASPDPKIRLGPRPRDNHHPTVLQLEVYCIASS